MKLPKTFIPDKDLIEKIKGYGKPGLQERISQLHEDPNLCYVVPSVIVSPEILYGGKLTLNDVLMIGQGEILTFKFNDYDGEKTLLLDKRTGKEVLFSFDKNLPHGSKNKKIPPTEVLRTIQRFVELSERKNEKCLYSGDFFEVSEDLLSDYITPEQLEGAKTSYLEKVRIHLLDAYFDEPNAIRNSVMEYVHMARAMWLSNLEHGEAWSYQDPLTKATQEVKIVGRYVFAIEEQMGKKTKSAKEEFRAIICGIYSQQVIKNPGYDFMDNSDLVNAVASVKLGSGMLLNIGDKNDPDVYNKILNNMTKNSGYCKSCAEKTLEYFASQKG
ncbi:hypothetical protein FJZ53_02085 [Candidatus Woesearchaeota archaeon]|nr:hypothetical protein [Candidatus Woesearchaeota archaeon]